MTQALLFVGLLGFVCAIGLKLADSRTDARGLLFLSLGLVCVAVGMGLRLDVLRATAAVGTVLVVSGAGLAVLSGWFMTF